MKTFLFCSLYYKKSLATGANKRFENFIFYFQKLLSKDEKILVVVKKGNISKQLMKLDKISFSARLSATPLIPNPAIIPETSTPKVPKDVINPIIIIIFLRMEPIMPGILLFVCLFKIFKIAVFNTLAIIQKMISTTKAINISGNLLIIRSICLFLKDSIIYLSN